MILGFAILAVLATMLASALRAQTHAMEHLRQSRADQRRAEQLLTDIQTNANRTALPANAKLDVLASPPIGQHVWGRITLTDENRQTTLIGLIPTPTAQPTP
jgi:hypothetical protein